MVYTMYSERLLINSIYLTSNVLANILHFHKRDLPISTTPERD